MSMLLCYDCKHVAQQARMKPCIIDLKCHATGKLVVSEKESGKLVVSEMESLTM